MAQTRADLIARWAPSATRAARRLPKQRWLHLCCQRTETALLLRLPQRRWPPALSALALAQTPPLQAQPIPRPPHLLPRRWRGWALILLLLMPGPLLLALPQQQRRTPLVRPQRQWLQRYCQMPAVALLVCQKPRAQKATARARVAQGSVQRPSRGQCMLEAPASKPGTPSTVCRN